MVLAQKPYDMGYMAVAFAMADWNGVTSLAQARDHRFRQITLDNVDDPAYSPGSSTRFLSKCQLK
jgi:ribose transport system substrate-binding protein